MKLLLSSLAGVAAVGLVLSTAVHIAALLGLAGAIGDFPLRLGQGLFIVWIPTVFVAARLTRNYPMEERWEASLRGCPGWMRSMVCIIVGYGVFNFIIVAGGAPGHPHAGTLLTLDARAISGHLMIFYSFALATLFSAVKVWDKGWEWRCPNGHEVRQRAKFCDECGQPIPDTEQPPAKPFSASSNTPGS